MSKTISTQRAAAGGYSLPIEEPKTKKHGLRNFVQMIINRLEAGEVREALYTAVDLRGDLSDNYSPYDSVFTAEDMQPRLYALQAEFKANHQAEVANAYERGLAAGKEAAKAELIRKLGLL